MEPTTDREIMIQLDGNIKSLREAIERFAESLEHLEQNRIRTIENRVTKLEKFVSEWSGAYKLIAIGALILSLINLALKINS